MPLPIVLIWGHGQRPELTDAATENRFVTKLIAMFNRLAPKTAIKALTAFSLPEGREPAHIDEWVFLAFQGRNGQIIPEDIKILDKDTGGELLTIGRSESASMLRDDSAIYDLTEINPQLENKLRETVLLFETDRSSLATKISDRREILVPNTSCASCHKLNGMNFNFHNFSYFEELDLEIAPRTIQDTALDLLWLRNR